MSNQEISINIKETQSKLIQDYINLAREQRKEISRLQNRISQLVHEIQDLQCMLIVNTKERKD